MNKTLMGSIIGYLVCAALEVVVVTRLLTGIPFIDDIPIPPEVAVVMALIISPIAGIIGGLIGAGVGHVLKELGKRQR